MKRYSWYVLPLLLIWACGNEPQSETPPQTTVDSVVANTDSDTDFNDGYPFLTNANCVEFLTKFGAENPETRCVIETEFGEVKLKLYEETPLHRANFVYLIKRGYFDQNSFYRIIPKFMIQGGNTENEDEEILRSMIGAYKLPAEIKPDLYHKKGALAAPRDYENNPDKKSNPYQFYIVHGVPLSIEYLEQVEVQYDRKIPENRWNDYLRRGGVPHLDDEHTIFGEVTEGFDVITKIANQERDEQDWPVQNIIMKIRLED